jgi:hypothetical protein
MEAIFRIDDIDYYIIHDFAKIVQRSVNGIRKLCFTGNRIRKMRYIRVNSTIYIPVDELQFPFVMGGNGAPNLREIYHYTKDGEKYRCHFCEGSTEVYHEIHS